LMTAAAADTLVYVKRPEGTIADASSAFHASVLVQNYCLFVFQGKNSMRAYLSAYSAAYAQIGKELKTCYFREVFHISLHSPSL
jgi:hypothetical protein